MKLLPQLYGVANSPRFTQYLSQFFQLAEKNPAGIIKHLGYTPYILHPWFRRYSNIIRMFAAVLPLIVVSTAVSQLKFQEDKSYLLSQLAAMLCICGYIYVCIHHLHSSCYGLQPLPKNPFSYKTLLYVPFMHIFPLCAALVLIHGWGFVPIFVACLYYIVYHGLIVGLISRRAYAYFHELWRQWAWHERMACMANPMDRVLVRVLRLEF